MKPLRCSLPLLLSCLGLLRGETRGPPGTEPRRVRIPEGSPLFIPTMNLTSARVMWSRTHAPDCRGAPIITVLYGDPWSFTSALGGRVQKSLYGGSIVIDGASRHDEGFYTICTSSSEPLLVIELVLTGLHVLQVILGCELREDGSAQWIEKYAYDGSNLNTANMGRATGTQDRENSEEMKCTEHLKKLLKFGEESLLRRVTPRTMVSQRKSGDRTFLIGYAYGFYPREIEVKWVQDGAEIPWASKKLLPNPDGTYQVRTTVDVQEGDDVKTYEFHVNHCSLPGTVTATYGPRCGCREGCAEVELTVLKVVTGLLTGVLLVSLGLVLYTLARRRRQSTWQRSKKVELELQPCQ